MSVDVEKKIRKKKSKTDENTTTNVKEKHDKKKKRNHSSDETEASNENMVVDGQVETKKSKKDKKRKHEHNVDNEVSNETPESEGKKKKKRRKEKSGDETSTALDVHENPSKSQVSSPPSTFASIEQQSLELSQDQVSAYLEKHSISIDFGSAAATASSSLTPFITFAPVLSRIPKELHSTLSKFKEPTPIQACSWPAILDGRDAVGIAETGSGKTMAFGLPAVARLISSRQSQADTPPTDTSSKPTKKSKGKSKSKSRVSILVLAPTRELALQTHETFSFLGETFKLKSVALYGGVDKEPQRRALMEENAAMVVGTPGRILDLLNEGACDFSGVNYLVLDEADRMLDKGFENDIRAIIGHTGPPEQRQTLMFSATWPDAVKKLAASFQRNPVRVTVGSDDLTANSRVEQVVEVFEDTREKDSRLISHLRNLKARKGQKSSEDQLRILVFVLYKKEASRVEYTLKRQGYSVGGIHGDLSQQARISALEDFKTGTTQVLVATDVAARGLDIPNVGTVINYSFPLTIEDYIHRIGRTGRAGRSGKSITFFTGDNHEKALAGELARVLRDGGFDTEPLKKFPMTIKKKTHSVYGNFFRDDIPSDAVPTRLKF